MKTVEPPSNVWFSLGQSAFAECSLFPRELGEPPGRLSFFPQARSKTFQNVCYFLGKRESRPRGDRERLPSDLRATCEDKFCGEERQVFIELRRRGEKRREEKRREEKRREEKRREEKRREERLD